MISDPARTIGTPERGSKQKDPEKLVQRGSKRVKKGQEPCRSGIIVDGEHLLET